MLATLVMLMACSATPSGPGGGDSGSPADSGVEGDGGEPLPDSGGDGGAADDGDPCIETEVPLSAATPPVTVEEVWPVLESWLPSGITWTRDTATGLAGESESFSVVFEQSGAPSVVTRIGWDEGYETHPTACRPGPELRVPVTAMVTVAGGEAVATHVGYLDALAPEPTRIFFTSLEADPVTLSPAWREAAAAQVEAGGHSIEDATRIYATMVTSQTQDLWQPEWAVEVRSESPEGNWWGGVLWQGALH